jgi:hypothetical protein
VPAMAGPLVANPNAMSFDGGPLGKVYLTGALTGIGLFQNDPGIPPIGDHHSRVDLSSGLVQLQNTEGMLQFFVQAGLYSFPALGAPYFQSWKATGDFFGPVPVAYAKIVPNDMVSVQVGKLPTLFGAEYGFTHQNMNIERGLLWAQEPIVSRGKPGARGGCLVGLAERWLLFRQLQLAVRLRRLDHRQNANPQFCRRRKFRPYLQERISKITIFLQ